MKVIKCKVLFDGINERRNFNIGFENDEIKYVGSIKPKETGEIIAEGVTVTPTFIDPHSHVGMVRSSERDKEEEANEHMNSVCPLANALHSIYMDDPAFKESVENGVFYSTVLPGSGNIIAGNAALIRNFVQDISQAYIMQVGIKAALEYNSRSTIDWKGNRPSTRMGAVAILRENFKARKMQKLIETEKKAIEEVEPITELFMTYFQKESK